MGQYGQFWSSKVAVDAVGGGEGGGEEEGRSSDWKGWLSGGDDDLNSSIMKESSDEAICALSTKSALQKIYELGIC